MKTATRIPVDRETPVTAVIDAVLMRPLRRWQRVSRISPRGPPASSNWMTGRAERLPQMLPDLLFAMLAVWYRHDAKRAFWVGYLTLFWVVVWLFVR